MINGRVYDFQAIKLTLVTGYVADLESIDYSDKTDDEIRTGTNGVPIGIGRGEYSGECTVEMSLSDYSRIEEHAKGSGGFYNLPPMDIVVSYGYDGQEPITDELQVHFNERSGLGASKGDKALNIQLKGVLTKPLVRNGSPSFTPA